MLYDKEKHAEHKSQSQVHYLFINKKVFISYPNKQTLSVR